MLRGQYSERISGKEEELRGFEEERKNVLDNKTDQYLWIEEFKRHRGIETLSRKDVVHMIERIDIVSSKCIEVHFRFIEEYDALVKQTGIREAS